MHVGITGASGLIGTALTQHLRQHDHQVSALVRRTAGTHEIEWDPSGGRLDPAAIEPLDAVVHLAGAGIGDHRWTEEYKQTILDSRVDGTTLLANTLASLGSDGPRVLLSGSAIGFYGDRDDETVDERSVGGTGFLPEVCRQWEAATAPAEAAGVRVAHLRTGIVLSSQGGALKKMLPLFKFGVGGKFGSGEQWMSWISIDDEVRAISHLLTADREGPVNLTAPNPVRNAEFVDTLGDVLNRPSFVPVPKFGPKLLLGPELAEALLFDSQRVEPAVLLAEEDFAFAHPDLTSALRSALDR
ncbi:MAG: TIGR01777 family protein [Ilumatobacter sp.]|nr:TIGR01777 family protein [Ilumatobacter sp.]